MKQLLEMCAILVVGALVGVFLEAILGGTLAAIVLLVLLCIALVGMWRSK